MPSQIPSIDELKQQAKRLRSALGDSQKISHSAALETVARQHGYKDWNTLSAMASQTPPHQPNDTAPLSLGIGQAIAGQYMGQSFTARIKAVRSLAGGDQYRITLDLDEAVDVVSFDSFSNFRKRINGTIDRNGISAEKRSDGVPHLLVNI